MPLTVTHLRVEKPFRWIYYNFNVQYIWTEMKCLLTYNEIVGRNNQNSIQRWHAYIMWISQQQTLLNKKNPQKDW